MKGKDFLRKMRPDLAELDARIVQARATIGICDENGIPRAKNRWFIVTARPDREVQLGGTKQQRSSSHPDFKAWNWTKDKDGKVVPLGRKTLRMRLQHITIDDAIDVVCRCQRDPEQGNEASPPGKAPYCSSQDGETARRWDGQVFREITCEGSECSLRGYFTDKKGNTTRAAKTVFTLVGRLDDDVLPNLLISVSTGSDFNLKEFLGLVEDVERQWAAMCDRAKLELDWSWFGLPIELTEYDSTSDSSRYPRIHYSLAVDLATMWRIVFEQTQSFAQMGRALAPPATKLLTPALIELTDDEVIFPESGAFDADTGEPVTPTPTLNDQPTRPEAPAFVVTPLEAKFVQGFARVQSKADHSIYMATRTELETALKEQEGMDNPPLDLEAVARLNTARQEAHKRMVAK